MQYLAGEMSVQKGSVIPLQASHNTVRMRFDIEEAEYIHLYKTDASFPLQHFSALSDPVRNKVRPMITKQFEDGSKRVDLKHRGISALFVRFLTALRCPHISCNKYGTKTLKANLKKKKLAGKCDIFQASLTSAL